jgi:putative membrane protein
MSVIAASSKSLRTTPLVLAFIAAWILAMIAQPILRWLFGDSMASLGISAAVLLQVTAVGAVLVPVWGSRRTAITFGAVMALAWGVEYLGSHTGFPFGHYDYTTALQPQIGGVPALIPLAWLMMLPPAWAVARTLSAHLRGWRRQVAFVLLSALAFTAWDLFLDPQMVAWGFWQWAEPSGYFGIPWVNFAGWVLSSLVITAIIRPPDLPIRPLLVVYAITWALETIGLLFFWRLPGPALVGGVVMGAFLLLALRAERHHAARSREHHA